MSIRKLVIAFIGALSATGTFHTQAAANEDIAHGKILAQTCMACHGVDNFRVDPAYAVPRLGQQVPRYIFNALKAYRTGERKNALMQAQVASLKEQDMRDVAAYFGNVVQDEAYVAAVRALGEGKDTDPIPAKVNEVCGSCHGETGGGGPEVPTLAGQHADYLSHALNQYRSGQRKNPVMSPLTRDLTQAEIRQLADYFSIQTMRPFSLRTVVAEHPSQNPIETATLVEKTEPPASAVPLKTALEVIQSLDMLDIPGGKYEMGDDASEGFAVGSPKHAVTITAFRIGKYEVTFEQYDAFAKATQRKLPDDEGWGRGTRPVINLTWADIQAFIRWLNHKTNRHFRLPSESEWEYAARAATTTVYWWGDKFDPERMNASGVNKNDHWLYTAPVGQFEPNPFGLYDTSGNVWERVADCWHSRYDGAPVDGSAWLGTPCYTRVMRGGSWHQSKRPMRSSARAGTGDQMPSMAVGFRLAEDVK